MFGNFFRTVLFSEKLLLHTFLTTLTQELLFRSIYFFRATASFKELCFWKSYFFAAVIFSKYLLPRTKLLPSSHFLRIGSSLGKLLFGTATFLKSSFDQNRYFCIASAFSEVLNFWNSYFFRKEIFCTTYFPWKATLLEQPLFQITLPSIAATFSKELLSQNILFQKSCSFIATLPLHSYTYYLSASN